MTQWHYKTKNIPIIEESAIRSWDSLWQDIKEDFNIFILIDRAKNYWHQFRHKKPSKSQLLSWDYSAFKEFVKQLLDHHIIDFKLSQNKSGIMMIEINKSMIKFKILFFMGEIIIAINDVVCMGGKLKSQERANHQAITAFHWFFGMYHGDLNKNGK